MNPWLFALRKQWELFCSFGPTGKFLYLTLIPMWLPFVIAFWIIQALIVYAFLKHKAKREVAEQMAPSLAELAHKRSWQQRREERERAKAAPRPTTNTLYGGTAPTEKSLGD